MIRVPLAPLRILSGLGLLCLNLLLTGTAWAAPPGQALVIGEAAYTGFAAIPACALSAHSVADALRGLGFSVVEQQNPSDSALFEGIARLTRNLQAHPGAPAFVYVCSYITSFAGRPFLLPVSATLKRPADVLAQGLLVTSLVDAVLQNSRATSVIAIDAIPAPKAPSSLSLHRLTHGLPPRLGLIAVRDAASGDQPTPFSATLVPALHGVVQSARLLARLRQQLSTMPASRVDALKLPSKGLLLASQSAAAAEAAAPAPPAAAPAPPAPAATHATLPNEARMTAAQRRQVQRALAKRHDYRGRIDAIFGPETRAAIRRWQRSMNLPVTGRLDAAEASRLVGG